MRPRDFNKVSYTFKLYDTTGEPVSGTFVELQYLDGTTQQWTSIRTERFADGVFYFEEPLDAADPPVSIFLLSDIIPELRLVAKIPIYGSTKPEVFAFTCQVVGDESDPNATVLAFDFGKAFLIEQQLVPEADMFSAFVVITSPLSLVNEMNNLALIQELQEDIVEKDAEIAALNLQLEAKDVTINSLNEQLLAALSRVQEKTLEVTRLESINDTLEETIIELREQVAFLQEQMNIDSRPVPVSTLYGQLVKEIDTSTRNNTNGGFKLANISLKLKALITRDQNSVSAQLFDLSSMDQVNGDAVSEITFDIAPTPPLPPRGNSMPNVLGLTETAVRKVLGSLGLRLNPVYQNNPQVVDGDSFRQSPEEGGGYSNNDFVTVIFSKHE